jgi:hypothetical protein
MLQYNYPISDLYVTEWSGSPNNTSKYTNIDEGVTSPALTDYIWKSGLVSQINGRNSFQFGMGGLHVIPSSCFLNININVSSSNTATGNLYLERVLLSDISYGIPTAFYEYKSAGEPIYTWGISSDYSTNTVILSGLGNTSTPLNSLYCDIRLSGNFSATVPSTDNFKISVSALEFLSSGTISVEYSGMPLYLKAPGPVTECLTITDASGYPVGANAINSWLDEVGDSVENDTSWWMAIKDGTHTPNDSTYIRPSIQGYQHPSGIGSLRANSPSWTNENGSSLTIQSINSGVSSPVDTSYFRTSAVAGIPGLQESPELLFRGPTNLTSVGVQFRAQRYITDDTFTIKNVKLKNSAGTILHSYSDELTVGGELQNLAVTSQSSSSAEWSTDNNILIFDVYASPASLMLPSGNLRITEIDIVTTLEETTSPNLYFNRPTLSNISGSTACFRVRNESGSDFPVTLNNISWRDRDDNTVVNFPDVTFTPVISSYANFCTGPAYPLLSSINDVNFLRFQMSVPSGNFLDDIHFSEIEVCNTGLDVVSSSYIPLYTYGVGTSNSGLDLYVQGHGMSTSGVDLYIYGMASYSSGIPLYTSASETISSGIPLFINGIGFSNSGISLYTQGPIPSDSYMPLFLKTDTIPSTFGSIPLHINSTTNSGLFKTIPMFIQGTGDLSSYMPLFLKGQESDSTSSNMPLFLKTVGNLDGSMTVESGLPLFLGNYWSSQSSGIPLYVQVQSGTLGAIPTSASMPLFIARDSEATANFLPLTIKVADTQNSGIPLYTFGAFLYNSGIPLVIPSTKDTTTNNIPLFSHGF